MTLNLLFRHPGLYRTGMAVAPVPDMRLYDTIYQERYMGLPQDYKKGSPITHTAGLKGTYYSFTGVGTITATTRGQRNSRTGSSN